MIPDDPYRVAAPGELPEDRYEDDDGRDEDEAYEKWKAETL